MVMVNLTMPIDLLNTVGAQTPNIWKPESSEYQAICVQILMLLTSDYWKLGPVYRNSRAISVILLCDKEIKQVFFTSSLREPTVNRRDLQALTLAGPTRKQPSTRPPSCATPQQSNI